MKQLTAILLAMLMIATPLGAFIAHGTTLENPVEPCFAGGDGSPGDPYQISNVTHLQDMNTNLGASYILINDIDAGATSGWPGGFDSIGDDIFSFDGDLEGNGYVISNLYINRPSEYFIGLFGYIGNAFSIITNITLLNCDITGGDYTGSIAGVNTASTTNNWYASGSVSGEDIVGGLIAYNWGGGSTIQDSNSDVDVIGSGDYIGGFCGMVEGIITNCFSTGSVSGNNYVGGFIGSVEGAATVSNCYSTGAASGIEYVGGFVGLNTGTQIDNSYSTASASATGNYVGGFAGLNEAGIIYCYSTGKVIGVGGDLGGFTGMTYGTITNCFWDTETSEWVTSDGAEVGRGTANMMNNFTFTNAGWNFGTVWWSVNASTRPFLRMEWGQEIRNSHQLQLMQMNLTADYTLACDIDLSDIVEPSQMWGTGTSSGMGFLPVGNDSVPFIGELEGAGHSISNLYIDRASNNVGLFGESNVNSVVANLTLSQVNVTGNMYVGGIAGYNWGGEIHHSQVTGVIHGLNSMIGGIAGSNSGVIDNAGFNGTIDAPVNYVGGITGRNAGGPGISNSTARGTINGANWVGGIAGDNFVTIQDCENYAHIDGGMYTGGITGVNTDEVVSCHNYGTVEGSSYLGGLVGNNAGGTVTGSTSSGDVSSTSNYVGGLIGRNTGTTSYSCASGTATGYGFTGGLVGCNEGGGISSCNSTGTVYGLGGGEETGGFAGANYGDIATCFSTGDAIGNDYYVGGFVGYNHGSATISYCNSTGTAYGLGVALDIGGFAGANEGDIDNCSSTGDAVGNDQYVGGFAGDNNSPITNCHAHGNASGTDYVGGFAGYNWDEVINCHSTGNASGNDYVGGFIGYSGDFPITNCTSTGSVTGDWYLGGFIGYSGDSPITNCTSTGSVTGTVTGSRQGGFVGENHAPITNCSSAGNITGCDVAGFVASNRGSITDCHSTGNVNGAGNAVGGFVGLNEDNITRCFSTGDVTGLEDVGGFAGDNVGGNITECYSIGNAVSTSAADSFVGGFIGVNAMGGQISDCYGWGAASGAGNYGGGFAAGNYAGSAITNCYSIGNVSAADFNGGFIYVNTGTVTACFWDEITTGTLPTAAGTPKTTAEMMAQATFNPPWNFTTVWGIHEANTYPFLRAFGIPPEPQADLEVTLEDLADPVTFGDVFTYHATLINHGPDNAADVKVNVTLPTEVTLIDTGPGMVVTGGRWITGNPGTVANGAVLHLFINVTVISNGTGILNCTAFVTSTTLDPGFYPNETHELTGINRAPTVQAKSWQCTEDYMYLDWAPGVLWGAGDPDGASDIANITVVGHESSDYGAAITILPDGNFTYDPTVSAALQALHTGMTVFDTFNYTVSDGRGGFASALITMQVDGQEGAPTAVNDTFTVVEESGPNVLNGILSNDIIDEEGDAITISSVSVPWQGTATVTGGGTTITFEPRENYFGTFTFTYMISDSHSGTSTGGINMTVTGVNDAPFITNVGISSLSAQENEPYSYVFQGIDVDADVLTWSLSTNATWLTMNPATGNLSGTPPIGSAGDHTVNITVGDSHGGEDWHEFTLTVTRAYDPSDSDGDGVPNDQDAFPDDPNETTDTDGDGIGDIMDIDDDGDGVHDVIDAFPLDPDESVDTDGDGIGDNADTDDDGDGIPDSEDDNPLIPDEEEEEGGGSNFTLIILIIVIVAVIAGIPGMMLLRPKDPKTPEGGEEEAGEPEPEKPADRPGPESEV